MTSSVVARPPCFRALPRVFSLPASVFGPVLLAALTRWNMLRKNSLVLETVIPRERSLGRIGTG